MATERGFFFCILNIQESDGVWGGGGHLTFKAMGTGAYLRESAYKIGKTCCVIRENTMGEPGSLQSQPFT